MRPRVTHVLLLLTLLVGCRDEAGSVPAETLAAQHDAARDACIGAELLEAAEADLTTLENSVGGAESASSLAQASRAALLYARTYYQHAQLRAAALAYADSAVNHAAGRADSVRYMENSTQYATRPPEQGTLEANVTTAYARDFAAIRADADHPCNWSVEAS